ncbi:hypothetical protein [Bacillus sp. FJAT-44742]|uniref:hypothetical protein n=1 Tax=Bacillus sp. FJAT-44742 TaxID=2014005 RepID=UPI0012FED083|nr:hypothetical protein [Bacillus sp. FJAT-44742]
MKKSLLLVSLSSVLVLGTACNGEEDDAVIDEGAEENGDIVEEDAQAPEEDAEDIDEDEQEEEEAPDPDEELDEEEAEEETTTAEGIDDATIIYEDTDLGIEEESGPISLSIQEVLVGEKDDETIVAVLMEAQNNEEDTVIFYPNQASLSTNTGEEVNADIFDSGSVGGEFGEDTVEKDYVIFYLDMDPAELETLTLSIEGATDGQAETIGDDLEIEINLNDAEEE